MLLNGAFRLHLTVSCGIFIICAGDICSGNDVISAHSGPIEGCRCSDIAIHDCSILQLALPNDFPVAIELQRSLGGRSGQVGCSGYLNRSGQLNRITCVRFFGRAGNFRRGDGQEAVCVIGSLMLVCALAGDGAVLIDGGGCIGSAAHGIEDDGAAGDHKAESVIATNIKRTSSGSIDGAAGNCNCI